MKCFFVQLAIPAQSEKEAAVFRVQPPAQRRTEGRLTVLWGQDPTH